MDDRDKVIWILCVFFGFILFYMYAMKYWEYESEGWVFVILIPLLLYIFFSIIFTVQKQTLLNSGGSLNVFNYYSTNPVYLQIIEDNKHYAWDDYVDPNSVTQYEWTGEHELQIIASDDPNIGNPSTQIFFDLTYNVTGNNTILIMLNADGSYFEQLNVL